MRKFIFIAFLVFNSNELLSQVFVPDSDSTGLNYYFGFGIGQAQLDIKNDFGTFGRTSNWPRLSLETGILLKTAPNQSFSFSFRTTYQNLYLHSPSNKTRYNDRISFLDAQFKPMLHLGSKKFMVMFGFSIRYPIYSKFEVLSKNSNGEDEWYKLTDRFKPEKFSLVPEFGTKIKFRDAQLGFIFSVNNNDFFKSLPEGPYSINKFSYYTLEVLIYLPLNL